MSNLKKPSIITLIHQLLKNPSLFYTDPKNGSKFAFRTKMYQTHYEIVVRDCNRRFDVQLRHCTTCHAWQNIMGHKSFSQWHIWESLSCDSLASQFYIIAGQRCAMRKRDCFADRSAPVETSDNNYSNRTNDPTAFPVFWLRSALSICESRTWTSYPAMFFPYPKEPEISLQ